MYKPLTINSETSIELPVSLWWLSTFVMVQQKKKKKKKVAQAVNNHYININLQL